MEVTSMKVEGKALQDLHSDESILLEGLESYLDELNDRLTVSRMVSDSMVRGMVNAISQEAAEHISAKDEEISRLTARLNINVPGIITDNAAEFKPTPLSKSISECAPFSLMNCAEIHLQSLKGGIEAIKCSNVRGVDVSVLMKIDEDVNALTVLLPSVCNNASENFSSTEDSWIEQKFQWDFERELSGIILRTFLKDLQEEQNSRLECQISIIDLQNEHRLEKIVGLWGSIQELDSISKSILNVEPGSSPTHAIASKMVSENDIFDISGSPLEYYRTEVNRIKRLLEASIHDKTEELFRLKRELLRDKGFFRRKKEQEIKGLRRIAPNILKHDNIPLVIEKCFTDQTSYRENQFGLEKDNLKHEMLLLGGSVEAIEKFFSEVESKLDEQKRRLDRALSELSFLSTKTFGHGNLMSLGARLDEALCQIQERDAKLHDQDLKLVTVSNNLNEAKKENVSLSQMVKHSERKMLSAVERSDEQGRQMESIIRFVHNLSKSITEYHSNILASIQVRNCRLEGLHYQLGDLVKEFEAVKRRESWYRWNLEMRFSDLQKAETEVDVLGDEVDNLLNILEKVYTALDYYSPVLLHYPGVVETLKLVRRKLKGSP